MKKFSATKPSSPVFQTSLVAALFIFGAYFDHVATRVGPATVAALRADLVRERAAPEVQQLAHWAVDSQDHAGLPFVVIDKTRARLFAFDSQGRFRRSTPVLLGASHEDGPVGPATPAGRFVADSGLSAHSDGIVWVHAGTALSLHSLPSDANAARDLASASAQDKRTSDGSVHVAADFYRDYLSPLRAQPSLAYVLPEALPWQQVIGQQRLPWPQIFAQAAHLQ